MFATSTARELSYCTASFTEVQWKRWNEEAFIKLLKQYTLKVWPWVFVLWITLLGSLHLALWMSLRRGVWSIYLALYLVVCYFADRPHLLPAHRAGAVHSPLGGVQWAGHAVPGTLRCGLPGLLPQCPGPGDLAPRLPQVSSVTISWEVWCA